MVLSHYVGARVRRKEDPRLIKGTGTYVDDVRIPGLLHLAFVRSPYPHARIGHIDVAHAAAMPGVVDVVTGAQLADLLHPTDAIGGEGEAEGTVGEPEQQRPEKRPMATDRVRHVGEAVVAVVAETIYQARDAADAVVVDYDPLPAVVDPEAAMRDGAPRLWDELPNNVAARWNHTRGDVDAAFKDAPVVVRQRIKSNRLAGVPMETRGVLATPDPATGGLTFWTSTQAPHWNRKDVAQALGLGQNQVRAIAPQVGGGFGVKIGSYPEDFIVSAIAYKLGRPVKWIETRSENFQATHQGRAQIADIEVAADRDGKIRAYRLHVIQDQGAFPKDTSLQILTGAMAVGCYDIPAVDLHAVGACTNTMDIGAYRGAGRPEAAYYIERAVDLVADAAGLDPAEVRRRNFIDPGKFPVTTATGERYDTGDYAKALDRALEESGYQQLRREQAEARKQGRYLGIGLASYVEICGFGPWESATVRVEPGGAVTVYSGICPQGQGQETAFAQLVADELGADYDHITVQFGDTATAPEGNGTMGSRGLAVGGGALMLGVGKLREKARRIAATMLEASLDDIELVGGRYRVKGAPDRSVALHEIAGEAYSGHLSSDIEPGLETTDFFRPPDETFPFGTHVALVEVMPGTGEVRILRYVSVDDCGVIVNPMLVDGQVQGGLAQGIAQALREQVVYDDSGQLLTGTLMDYAIPKADSLPMFENSHTETPTPLNPIGAKGIGEAATIGSTPAMANAVIDALEPFGIGHLDLPLTPQTVWDAIQRQGSGSRGSGERKAAD
ncbi:MAG TPA: molybdopterin cofactor-binding domain-containing protein [Thermomicrobiaceae bacterium]|nr:molybdopterin cofactor-binding domain-containing protein [Thermomicrobiaceae bacterium]